MSETTVRDVLHEAMTGDEPPIRPGLLGEVVGKAGRAQRRRVLASCGAAAAGVALLALGIPAVSGALAPSGTARPGAPALVPSAAQTARSPLSPRPTRHGLVRVSLQPFVAPKALRPVADPDPVAITRRSFGQVLVDDMPAGVRLGRVQVSSEQQIRHEFAQALVTVTSAKGSGFVTAQMYRVAAPDHSMQCSWQPDPRTCRQYRLAGDVRVSEIQTIGYDTKAGGSDIEVGVFRDGVEIWIDVADYPVAGGAPTGAIPLTMSEIVRAALDPRWGYTISKSFVEHSAPVTNLAPPAG
jgi:hypothetical protein